MLIMHLFNLLLAFVRMSHGSMNATNTSEFSFILFLFVLLYSILKSLENHDALIVLGHAPTEVDLLKLWPLYLLLVSTTHRVFKQVFTIPHTAV